MNRRGFLGGLLAAVGLARVGWAEPVAEVVLDPDDFKPRCLPPLFCDGQIFVDRGAHQTYYRHNGKWYRVLL